MTLDRARSTGGLMWLKDQEQVCPESWRSVFALTRETDREARRRTRGQWREPGPASVTI